MVKSWTIDEGDIRQMAAEAGKKRLEDLAIKYDSLDMLDKKTAERPNLAPAIAKSMALLADDIFVNKNVADVLMKMSYGDVEKKLRQELEDSKKRRAHWESQLAITACDCKLRESMPRTGIGNIHRASVEIRLEAEIEYEIGLLLAPIEWNGKND